MKVEVTLRVRGFLEHHNVNALNTNSAPAIAIQRLSPRIDRLNEVQVVQAITKITPKPVSSPLNLPTFACV
jgi:hypothetical protein